MIKNYVETSWHKKNPKRIHDSPEFDWERRCDWCCGDIDKSDSTVRTLFTPIQGYVHSQCIEAWLKHVNSAMDEEWESMGVSHD